MPIGAFYIVEKYMLPIICLIPFNNSILGKKYFSVIPKKSGSHVYFSVISAHVEIHYHKVSMKMPIFLRSIGDHSIL